jgi:hypothetical protein
MAAPLLKQVTAETKLHIDYNWWEESNLDLKTYLFTRLDLDESMASDIQEQVDLVDPETAEVRRVDGFQYVIQTYFNQLAPDFLQRSSLVDAVFCVLLANANRPMMVRDVAERVHRSPEVILKTFGGPRVYQGIRPLLEED